MTTVNSELRLAIIAAPRSGNTWLRMLLNDLLEVHPWPCMMRTIDGRESEAC